MIRDTTFEEPMVPVESGLLNIEKLRVHVPTSKRIRMAIMCLPQSSIHPRGRKPCTRVNLSILFCAARTLLVYVRYWHSHALLIHDITINHDQSRTITVLSPETMGIQLTSLGCLHPGLTTASLALI